MTSVSTERRARDMTNCNLEIVVDVPESHSSFPLGTFQDWFSNKQITYSPLPQPKFKTCCWGGGRSLCPVVTSAGTGGA